MNGPILWLTAAAAALLGIACIALFLERARLRARAAALEARTVGLEARLQQPQARPAAARPENAGGAPGRQRKETRDDLQRREELMSLRRDVAHARDEARKAVVDARARELEAREAREGTDGALHSLREENKRLVEQMREMERERGRPRPAQAQPAPGADAARGPLEPHVAVGLRALQEAQADRDAHELRELRREVSQARSRIAEIERRDAREDARAKEALAKLAGTERELRRFREAATFEGGRPLDPVTYVRWRDRAMEGRRMYRMMRQLRDLSDLKLASYQASVERLAAAFLSSTGAPAPVSPAGGAARADTLLRAALELLPPPAERPEAALPDDGSAGTAAFAPLPHSATGP